MSSFTPEQKFELHHKIDSHQQYLSEGIPSSSSLSPDPMQQFSSWFSAARSPSSGVPEPEAVALSTVSSLGVPSTRMVLLKRVDARGFVVFTNYDSRKGVEMGVADGGEGGKYASLAFYWREQHRSVRVVGRTERTSREETGEYFSGRPRGSQIGAWASPQSQVLPDARGELERLAQEVEDKFKEGDAVVEPPPFWGGVRIVPLEVEFWMGRESRLHDRFRYTREEGQSTWKVDRLAP